MFLSSLKEICVAKSDFHLLFNKSFHYDGVGTEVDNLICSP